MSLNNNYKKCDNCSQKAYWKCKNCKSAYYCSSKCQLFDWNIKHFKICNSKVVISKNIGVTFSFFNNTAKRIAIEYEIKKEITSVEKIIANKKNNYSIILQQFEDKKFLIFWNDQIEIYNSSTSSILLQPVIENNNNIGGNIENIKNLDDFLKIWLTFYESFKENTNIESKLQEWESKRLEMKKKYGFNVPFPPFFIRKTTITILKDEPLPHIEKLFTKLLSIVFLSPKNSEERKIYANVKQYLASNFIFGDIDHFTFKELIFKYDSVELSRLYDSFFALGTNFFRPGQYFPIHNKTLIIFPKLIQEFIDIGGKFQDEDWFSSIENIQVLWKNKVPIKKIETMIENELIYIDSQFLEDFILNANSRLENADKKTKKVEPLDISVLLSVEKQNKIMNELIRNGNFLSIKVFLKYLKTRQNLMRNWIYTACDFSNSFKYSKNNTKRTIETLSVLLEFSTINDCGISKNENKSDNFKFIVDRQNNIFTNCKNSACIPILIRFVNKYDQSENLLTDIFLDGNLNESKPTVEYSVITSVYKNYSLLRDKTFEINIAYEQLAVSENDKRAFEELNKILVIFTRMIRQYQSKIIKNKKRTNNNDDDDDDDDDYNNNTDDMQKDNNNDDDENDEDDNKNRKKIKLIETPFNEVANSVINHSADIAKLEQRKKNLIDYITKLEFVSKQSGDLLWLGCVDIDKENIDCYEFNFLSQFKSKLLVKNKDNVNINGRQFARKLIEYLPNGKYHPRLNNNNDSRKKYLNSDDYDQTFELPEEAILDIVEIYILLTLDFGTILDFTRSKIALTKHEKFIKDNDLNVYLEDVNDEKGISFRTYQIILNVIFKTNMSFVNMINRELLQNRNINFLGQEKENLFALHFVMQNFYIVRNFYPFGVSKTFLQLVSQYSESLKLFTKRNKSPEFTSSINNALLLLEQTNDFKMLRYWKQFRFECLEFFKNKKQNSSYANMKTLLVLNATIHDNNNDDNDKDIEND